ncbi:cwf18 domain containing protein [Hirsutella rhossiliensis]
MGSVPPFSTLASASLDRESRRIQHQVPTTLISDRPRPAQKKVICAKNKESPRWFAQPRESPSNSPTARAMSPEAQLEEICDQMQALDIQASAFRQINIDLWDNDITHDEKDKIAVTTYVAKFIFIVQSGSDQGYDLLGYFNSILKNGPKTHGTAPRMNTREPSETTKERGIYTEQEFTEMVFDERTAAFRRQTALLGSNASTNPHPSQPPSPSVTPLAAPHQGLNEPQPIKTLTSPPNAPTPAPTIQDKPAPTSLTIHPTSYRFQNPDLVNQYMKLPPDNIPNAIVDSDIQQKFMKTWNKDRNYTGEPYDLLDDKLRLFLSNCSHIQVKPPRFYLDKITWATTFRQAYDIFKQHFDTEVNHVHYHTDWTTITFNSIRAQDASKTPHEVLQILFDKLQLCQRALGRIPELQYALFKPADNVEHLLADLRASVETHLALITTSQFPLTLLDHLIITIHTISTTSTVDTITTALEVDTDIQVNDPAADTDKATTKAVGQLNTLRMNGKGQGPTYHSMSLHRCYILDYEGHEMSSFDDTEDTWEEHDNSTNDHPEQWQASQMLCQQAFNHLITGEDVYQTDQTVVPASQFIIEDRYSRDRFQGIMIDTAGYSQYIAYNEKTLLPPSNSATATPSTPRHRSRSTSFKPQLLLLCLADMDRLGIYFNNITDTINCTNHCTNRPTSIPVVRKWGHPWFFLTKDEESISFLTETEIRTLHRRFGHPAVPRLHHLLKQAGHTPRRFKFTLNDDQEFNYEIIVDLLLSRSQIFTVNTLRTLWIDTYLGPPDTLRHDAGTNFASLEFRNEAKIMESNALKYLLRRIGPLERLNAITHLRRAFNILHAEIGHTTSAETVLQMAVKAINDTAGPDGLVPTLLVFGAYPRVSTDSPPSASTLKRSEAMQKAMKMLRQLSAERRVKDALHARNGPSTTEVLSLPLQSEVRVWREKDGWQGPFKIASIDTHNITIDTVNGPQVFRSTLVQPYLRDDTTLSDPTHDTDPSGIRSDLNEQPAQDPVKTLTDLPADPTPAPAEDAHQDQRTTVDQSFLTQKEEDASSFPQATNPITKITDLVGRGVFQFERYDQMIKGINTKPYEKSRLVIQGHNDFEKTTLLTQSPTIQRVSQRLILAIAPGLLQNYGITLSLRDITQAYPQSQTKLSRTILTQIPNRTIIRVIKPLYGIAEAGVHWFRTYQQHHLEKLDMSTSTYDSCLLISNTGPDTLGIVGMQTDDTLILGTNNFSTREEEELQRQNFVPSPRLTSHTEQRLTLMVQDCPAKMTTIDPKAIDRHQRYVEERARASYIASIAQPEASFDVSVAAQRLQWQMDHQLRGLTYKPIDLATAKLMVFTDGSFANNKDLSSQLGFVITLVNETNHKEKQFEISGNIVHWSSTKHLLAMTMKIITERLNLPPIPLIVCTDSYSLYECLVKLEREITDIRWINGADNPADAMTKASPNRALERFIDTNSLTIRVEGYEDPFTSSPISTAKNKTKRRVACVGMYLSSGVTNHGSVPFLHAGLCLLR